MTVYAAGMMALSLCYVLPTYFILALAVVFSTVTATYPPLPLPRIDGIALRRLACASIGFLAFIYLVVRVVRV